MIIIYFTELIVLLTITIHQYYYLNLIKLVLFINISGLNMDHFLIEL